MDQETKKEFNEIKSILKSNTRRLDSHDKKFDTLASAIKENQTLIKENQKAIHKQGFMAERRDEKIDQILEAVEGIAEKQNESPTKKEQREINSGFDSRISALETKVKEI